MQVIYKKRCIIGESPVWNDFENCFYFLDAILKEIYKIDLSGRSVQLRRVKAGCNALCFDMENRLIVSREDGVYYLNADDSIEPLYDLKKYNIINANDMKVGPNGSIYVGTISGLKKGVSSEVDGKLYRIDKFGKVSVLLDNLTVSNGMAWSKDGKKFYHTDSITGYIKEYDFNIDNGDIAYTGRRVFLAGVDGFTIDSNDRLIVPRWDDKKLSVVDTLNMEVVEEIKVPFASPVSCCFGGIDLKSLIIVTANYDTDISVDKNAGYTFLLNREVGGISPFRFNGRR